MAQQHSPRSLPAQQHGVARSVECVIAPLSIDNTTDSPGPVTSPQQVNGISLTFHLR
jgi:hypothetical protein